MSSFRRLALVLALGLPAAHVVLAQSSSSSSNPATPTQQEGQTQQSTASQSQSTLSVQARLRARREQRRTQAIHDAYSNRYDAFVGAGYLRFTPGSTLQRVHLFAWDAGVTRYFSERLGVTIDGRGYYGTPYVGLNAASITKPAISAYAGLVGPTYRFYLQPKYSVSGRVMGGYISGRFSGDTNGFGSTFFGLYADGGTYAISASAPVDYNLTPKVAIRVAPEYFATGFGSTMQNSLGFTAGIVYRFGKK